MSSTARGIYYQTATIADSGTTSNAVDSSGAVLCGVIIPANMEGTSLTFTTSTEADGTYVPLRDKGNAAISVTHSTAAGFFSLYDVLPFGLNFMKVVAGSSQTGEASLTLVFQRVV